MQNLLTFGGGDTESLGSGVSIRLPAVSTCKFFGWSGVRICWLNLVETFVAGWIWSVLNWLDLVEWVGFGWIHGI